MGESKTEAWHGAARPPTALAWRRAAARLGVDEAVFRAVFNVEAGGRFFDPDGSVVRRFEPHVYGTEGRSWRDSLGMSKARRRDEFRKAYAEAPKKALEACSWGAPQIMGHNAGLAGFDDVGAMVSAFAAGADAQIEAFGGFVARSGLAGALRARDWRAFARGYNGSGQVEVYARRLRRAVDAATGSASPAVISVGDQGAAVRELQRGLGLEVDGRFGPNTRSAVQRFQAERGLATDGIVGARTWAALREHGQIDEPPDAASPGSVLEVVGAHGPTVGAAVGTVETASGLFDGAQAQAFQWGVLGCSALLVAAGAWWTLRGGLQ